MRTKLLPDYDKGIGPQGFWEAITLSQSKIPLQALFFAPSLAPS